MRAFAAALLLSLIAATASAGESLPSKEYVPDAATATAIARAVLSRAFGQEIINDEEPLVAKRIDDIWIVAGTSPDAKINAANTISTVLWAGGVAEVRLSAKDGRILSMTHGQ